MPRLPIRLYNAGGRALRALGLRSAELAHAEAALCRAARRATGLQNFGPGPWREGLRVLLCCYAEEAKLTPFGRRRVWRELVGILSARLLSEAALRALPRPRPVVPRAPLFILGLPRTGTSALHFLLAQDPANQVLEFWLAAAPGPRPPRELWETDPRFRAARRGLKAMYWLDPGLEAIHRITADGPDECRHLLQQSFRDDSFDSNATLPSYTRWFRAQDPRPAYLRHRELLQLIGSPEPERRWVLKYPAHVRHLDAVLETYPEARFVWTHRDPARVLPSICSLVAGWRSLYEAPVDRWAIGSQQLELWAELMERGIAARRALGSERFVDLHHRELADDPVGAVGRLYQRLGLELPEAAAARMRAWHAAHPQGPSGSQRARAESFGLREAEIAERFDGYRAHFGIPREAEQSAPRVG